jgi:hypothetical protein
LPAQRLSRASVQALGDGIELALTEVRELHPFREVLSEQAVRVLVAPALPRAAGIAEVDLHLGRQSEGRVLRQLGAAVPGERRLGPSGRRRMRRAKARATRPLSLLGTLTSIT